MKSRNSQEINYLIATQQCDNQVKSVQKMARVRQFNIFPSISPAIPLLDLIQQHLGRSFAASVVEHFFGLSVILRQEILICKTN
jgi:hypothetical protein